MKKKYLKHLLCLTTIALPVCASCAASPTSTTITNTTTIINSDSNLFDAKEKAIPPTDAYIFSGKNIIKYKSSDPEFFYYEGINGNVTLNGDLYPLPPNVEDGKDTGINVKGNWTGGTNAKVHLKARYVNSGGLASQTININKTTADNGKAFGYTEIVVDQNEPANVTGAADTPDLVKNLTNYVKENNTIASGTNFINVENGTEHPSSFYGFLSTKYFGILKLQKAVYPSDTNTTSPTVSYAFVIDPNNLNSRETRPETAAEVLAPAVIHDTTQQMLPTLDTPINDNIWADLSIGSTHVKGANQFNYNSNHRAFTIGINHASNENQKRGFAFSYAQTNTDYIDTFAPSFDLNKGEYTDITKTVSSGKTKAYGISLYKLDKYPGLHRISSFMIYRGTTDINQASPSFYGASGLYQLSSLMSTTPNYMLWKEAGVRADWMDGFTYTDKGVDSESPATMSMQFLAGIKLTKNESPTSPYLALRFTQTLAPSTSVTSPYWTYQEGLPHSRVQLQVGGSHAWGNNTFHGSAGYDYRFGSGSGHGWNGKINFTHRF